jgi:hypothetical protein
MWRFHVFGEDNSVITASDFIYNSQQEALLAANEYVKHAVPQGEVWKMKTSQKWTG